MIQLSLNDKENVNITCRVSCIKRWRNLFLFPSRLASGSFNSRRISLYSIFCCKETLCQDFSIQTVIYQGHEHMHTYTHIAHSHSQIVLSCDKQTHLDPKRRLSRLAKSSFSHFIHHPPLDILLNIQMLNDPFFDFFQSRIPTMAQK